MTSRRLTLLLAVLLSAISCSDAGDPTGSERVQERQPDAGSQNVLAVLACDVDVRAGTSDCRPVSALASGASAAINIGAGPGGINSAYVLLTRSNEVWTPTSHAFDMTIKNNMVRQIIGTTDGVTAHSSGMKVFFYDPAYPTATGPVVTQKSNPALPASITVNGDGTQKFTGAGTLSRPYFQYAPQILSPGQTSTTRTWSFTLDNVASYSFVVYISTEVLWPKGWIELPSDAVVQTAGSATLTAQVRNVFGVRYVEGVNWSSSNPAIVTVTELAADSLAQITGVAEGTAWVRAASAADPVARRDSVLVTVDNAPVVAPDTVFAPARVAVRLSPARMRKGMAVSDSVVPGQSIGTGNGYATVDAEGGFTYVSSGVFTGVDSVRVDVTDGTWTVQRTIRVEVEPSNYWFVQPGGTGDGSNSRPLGSVNAAVAAADVNDSIFVLRNGGTQLVEATTLRAGQSLIGEGVSTGFLLLRSELNEPGGLDTIFQGAGVPTLLMNTGFAPTITVASNNRIEGVRIASVGAAGIRGVGFGTLTVDSVRIEAGGPALSLNNGTLAGTFRSLSSNGSDSAGISLTGVNGSLTADSAGISGASTTAFAVVGGSVSISFPGNVTHGGSGRAFDAVSHAGPVTFQGAWTVTGGTGIRFNGASGSYHFFGAVNLDGGDAGLDVVSSTGDIAFDDATVVSPTGGAAVSVTGGTPALVYQGGITHHNGRAVLIDGISADSVVLHAAIASGTSGAPTGQGILVQNVSGGRVVVNGINSLFTGTSPAVTLTGNTGGLVRFGGSLSITTTTGAGFSASGSDTLVMTGVNSITTTTGVPVSLSNVHTGSSGISFSTVTTTGGAANGIVLSSLASGAGFQATGGTITGTTGPAVQLTSMAGVDSTSIRGMTLSRSSGTGGVISGTSFGKLHVLNTSVTASSGPSALVLATGMLSGTFSTLSSNSSTASGVSLTNVGGTLNASGGSINTAGAAAVVLSGGSVGGTVAATLAQASAQPTLSVTNGHYGSITFAGNVAATNGNGLQFDNADGSYVFGGTVTLNGGDAGIDITNGSSGTFTFPATSSIVNPSNGNLVSILNSAPTFTYSGAFTKANNNVTGILISGNTGGSITFNGTGVTKSISSGSAAAVNLSNNTGALIFLTGGGLSLTSGTGNGLTATGGGTVQVTGASNVISSSGGIALNVVNTTIGSSGLSFQSINATGGSNGIVLNNVGAGGVQVTGSGGACTLASPSCSGGTIQNTTGDGVSLAGVQLVSLALVRILNTGGHGIAGTSTSGLALANSLIQGAGDADNEAGIYFATANATNLTGTVSISNTVVHAPADLGAYIHNYGGTLNLVVQGSTFSGTDAATPGVVTGDDLFRLIADRTGAGSSTITARFSGNTFDQSENDGLAGIAQSSTGSGGGTLNLTVDGNTFTGDNGGASCSSGCNDNGIVAWGTQGATVRFTIQNNSVQNQRNEAIGVRADNTASVQGTIQNNTIGTTTARSGSYTAQGILLNSDDGADLVVRVHNNLVRGTFWQGIWANAADGGGGAPALDLILTGNTTPTPYDNGGTYLPSIDVQGTTAAVVCAKVESNTAAAGQGSAGSIDILQFNTATFRIEGLPSPTTDASSYVAGQNPAAAAPVYAFAGGSGSTFTGATCRTPAATPSL